MPTNLLELSKQGNPDAIAALMNRHLQPQGIIARVLLQDRCLKVMLDAIEIPDQQTVAPFVLKGIANLKIPSVQTIQVYGRKRGEKAPAWTQICNPLPVKPSATPSLPAVPEAPVTNPTPIALTQVAEPIVSENEDKQSAIAVRLNQLINDEAITIKVEQQGTLLKVIAETDKFLEGPSFAKGIYQELLRLNLEHITTVDVYKQKRKGSHSFRIQSFVLTKEEAAAVSNSPASTTAKPDLQASKSTQPARSSQASSLHNPTVAPTHGDKKKENTNGIRRKLTIAFVAVAAGFIVIRLIGRLTWAFSSPMGWFSIAIALFFAWRAWTFLNPLLQQLLRDE